MTYELPKGWEIVKLEEVAIIVTGNTPPTNNKSYFNGNVPFFKPSDLNLGYVNDSKNKLSVAGKEFSRTLPKGSILVTCIGSTIGKSGIILKEGAFNQQINGVLPIISNPLFFYYQIITSNFQKQIKENSSATTVPILNKSKFGKLTFLMAPLNEQNLIVERIEELFSEVEQAEKELKNAKQQLGIYKQALLKSAFEGKLTNPNIKTGILPTGWKIIKIENISNVVRGGSPRPAGDPKYYGGNIPFLKVKDITKDEKVYLNTFEYTIKEAGLKKTRRISPRTLLLSNSGATLGIPKICMIDATINDGIAAFLDLDDRSIYYLYYYLLLNTQKLRNLDIGAAQPNLNTTIINNIELPYCSFEEQKYIVEILESRFTLIENLKESISKTLYNIKIFRHSILKKAFEGKLVNQNPFDEPANELIKRIEKEKRTYLKVQQELENLTPKKKRKMETKKTILEILKESKIPISTQELWKNSVHEGDIEGFYSEIKEIYSELSEVKEEMESLLSLRK